MSFDYAVSLHCINSNLNFFYDIMIIGSRVLSLSYGVSNFGHEDNILFLLIICTKALLSKSRAIHASTDAKLDII